MGLERGRGTTGRYAQGDRRPAERLRAANVRSSAERPSVGVSYELVGFANSTTTGMANPGSSFSNSCRFGA
jgi:hypothetical protein